MRSEFSFFSHLPPHSRRRSNLKSIFMILAAKLEGEAAGFGVMRWVLSSLCKGVSDCLTMCDLSKFVAVTLKIMSVCLLPQMAISAFSKS